MKYCECNLEEIKDKGFSIRDGKAICNSCGNPDISEKPNETVKATGLSKYQADVQIGQNQPEFDHTKALLEEVRELKALVKVLRWIVPMGFAFLMIYINWIGVKVNISPTLISPFSG